MPVYESITYKYSFYILITSIYTPQEDQIATAVTVSTLTNT